MNEEKPIKGLAEYRRLAQAKWSKLKEQDDTATTAITHMAPTTPTATTPTATTTTATTTSTTTITTTETTTTATPQAPKLPRALGQYISERADLQHLLSPHSNNQETSPQARQEAGDSHAERKREPQDPSQNEPTCRICGSGVEMGRLISPCLCIGTLRLVHIDCINTWRRLSANPQSYFQCDMCKYKYLVERTRFSQLMQSLNVAQVVTVLAVMMWALLFGVICYPLSLHEWFYELVEWVPFWFAEDSYFHRFATVLDYCTAGTLGMSLVGLALDTYFSIQVQNYHHVYLALACVANGPRHMRFIALLGIALSGRFVWRVVREKCLELLHRWGEMILEVRRE